MADRMWTEIKCAFLVMAPENITYTILYSPYHVGGDLGSHMFKLEEPRRGRRLSS